MERHSLLVECFKTSLRCIVKAQGASDTIRGAPYGPHHVISAKNNSQISCKIPVIWHPLCTANWIMRYRRGHPLLFESFITFLRCARIIGGASDSIYAWFMVHILSILSKTALKFHARCHSLGTLSALEIGYCAAMIDIHCCLSVS